MRVFLTGGTGFIGSHVLNDLHATGHCVIAIKYPGSEPVIPLRHEPDWIEGTLEDDYSEVLRRCDALIHLAAVGVNPQQATWENCFRWNVTASLHLWRQAVAAGVRRFVICGSCFEYGRSGERYDFIPSDAPLEPTGAYHSSKAAASMAALGLAVDANLEVAVLRPFHIYGEGEPLTRFWPALRQAALTGQDFEMTNGEQIRDFTPVELVSCFFIDALIDENLTPGRPQVYNVGTGRPRSLREFAEENWKEWDATGRLCFGRVPYRDNEVMRYVPDVSWRA